MPTYAFYLWAQGARTDLESCHRILRTTLSLLPCFERHFGSTIRYHRGFSVYLQELQSNTEPRPHTNLTLILGPPGTGKTMLSMTLYSAVGPAFFLSPPHCWWDGYRPSFHKVIVLDEFFGQISPSFLNRIVSHSPLTVNQKGVRGIGFRACELIIVSNISPLQWWIHTRVPISSLLRRIKRLIVMIDPYPSPYRTDIFSTNSDSLVCPLIDDAIHSFTDTY